MWQIKTIDKPDVLSKVERTILTLVAYITMFIDHAAKSVFYGIYGSKIPGDVKIYYDILRGIGRLAFPIFLLFLVEGFLRTKSKPKYLLRLGIGAMISEIPFNLCIGHSLWDLKHQSVMLELFFGFLMLWLLEKFIFSGKKLQLVDIPLFIGIVLIFGLVCEAGMFDYGFFGILSLAIIYLLKRLTKLPSWGIMIFGVAALIVMALNEWPALFLIPFMFILSKFVNKEKTIHEGEK